jgi:hypothetical protein
MGSYAVARAIRGTRIFDSRSMFCQTDVRLRRNYFTGRSTATDLDHEEIDRFFDGRNIGRIKNEGDRMGEETKKYRAATFSVSLELLADALALPEGTKIFWAEMKNRGLGDMREFEIYVEHEDLPEVKPGALYPEIVPLISIVGERPSDADWIEWDWNLDGKRAADAATAGGEDIMKPAE